MKCPLLITGYIAREEIYSDTNLECYKEDCAWWDETSEKCAVLELPNLLTCIGHELGQISKEQSRFGG